MTMTTHAGASLLLATSALGTATKIDLPDMTTTAAAEPDVREYEVAKGRTVDGRGPGEFVELDATDAKRLFDLGFILDESGSRSLLPEGPTVVAGADIKER